MVGNISPAAPELCYSCSVTLLQDSWKVVTGLLEKSYGGGCKKLQGPARILRGRSNEKPCTKQCRANDE